MRIVCIIQARMNSTRLPGKVLLDLAGEPMLARVVRRVQQASQFSDVVVATSELPDDRAIVNLCVDRGWPYYCGSADDVLDRYYQVAQQWEAEAVVRITADCPLIDPEVIDQVAAEFLANQPHIDCATNTQPLRTFPRGLDTSVFRFEALQRSWREALDPIWREHVILYIYRHADLFRLHGVQNHEDYSHLRWTVDTPEDYELIVRIYNHFGHDLFSWQEVLALLQKKPEWVAINRSVQQKVV